MGDSPLRGMDRNVGGSFEDTVLHLSSSGQRGGNQRKLQQQLLRRPSDEISSSSKSSSSRKSLLQDGPTFKSSSLSSKQKGFTSRYVYEWHEPSFFNNDEEPHSEMVMKSVKSPPPQESASFPLVDSRQNRLQLQIGQLSNKLEGIVMVEVAHGAHQLVHVSTSEMLTKLRAYTSAFSMKQDKQAIGDLTYRDIRQVFTATRPNPSIEVRRHCIIVCLPPVKGVILYDRCVFMINEQLHTDALLLKIEDLTAVYSKRLPATSEYWNKNKDALDRNKEAVSKGAAQQAAHMKASPKSAVSNVTSALRPMMFAREHVPSGTGDELNSPRDDGHTAAHSRPKLPRFIVFPLEFALLEVFLTTAYECIDSELTDLEEALEKTERRVTRKTANTSRLETLHILKSPTQALSDTIRSLAETFRDLFANREDMKYMELTRLYFHPSLYSESESNQVTVNPNVEILLEFFDQEANQFDRRVRHVLRSIENTEKLLTLRMAIIRNNLVYYELAGTVLSTFLNFGTCISGIFGMNLLNGLEESHTAFLTTSILIGTVGAVGIMVVTRMVTSPRM